ncbi:MAG: di-trans,poly-cis-decaprenylcistransferase [Candidatus Muproteobacteria bacterium RBG_16_60_9]|uniref:Isoprenyl transferase n=1 Tax=Candidatus Muproteobacteria bacterium RBG_16_60_9 TaxID=1817755 RepID=A0A1F6UXA4_9PROT|nr:MAG: di-trans,poly-cis-decaprenylcistransferase [Candidatus Muproteobacteria bacterium RBG_16_60_9]
MTRSATVAAPKVPSHVAVIMDGNGRWAKRRGLPRIAGHRKGQERVRELVETAGAAGVKYLTLFAFSSENWRRPEDEVRMLLDLFLAALDREVKQLHENQVRFQVIGDRAGFGEPIVRAIERAESLTRDNTALTLTIAANYGGRWDIAQACRAIAHEVRAGSIDPAQIGPDTIAAHLTTQALPEPDLFIRTGGEQRVSNFLLWQLAYTEMYFTPVLWPEFDREQFSAALAAYADRERRFGLTGEQVNAAGNA